MLYRLGRQPRNRFGHGSGVRISQRFGVRVELDYVLQLYSAPHYGAFLLKDLVSLMNTSRLAFRLVMSTCKCSERIEAPDPHRTCMMIMSDDILPFTLLHLAGCETSRSDKFCVGTTLAPAVLHACSFSLVHPFSTVVPGFERRRSERGGTATRS
jgi:hypothetical protein